MKLRLTSLALLVALVGAFVFMPRSAGTVLAKNDKGVLRNRPVAGTLPNGGTFKGFLTITELKLTNDHTGLLASGVLSGVAQVNGRSHHVQQAFTDKALAVTNGTLRTQTHEKTGSCQILFLEIPGGLFIDLLGLVIDIKPITIEIRAEPGEGKLLGNLLCLIVHLLDPRPR